MVFAALCALVNRPEPSAAARGSPKRHAFRVQFPHRPEYYGIFMSVTLRARQGYRSLPTPIGRLCSNGGRPPWPAPRRGHAPPKIKAAAAVGELGAPRRRRRPLGEAAPKSCLQMQSCAPPQMSWNNALRGVPPSCERLSQRFAAVTAGYRPAGPHRRAPSRATKMGRPEGRPMMRLPWKRAIRSRRQPACGGAGPRPC
jgi:hypothetical protein